MTKEDNDKMATLNTSSSTRAFVEKPHQAPTGSHNQFIKDPVAHFRAMPWCATLLNDPNNLEVIVPDRRPLPSGESNFVRRTMNNGTAVRACVSFRRRLQPAGGKQQQQQQQSSNAASLSRSKELLKGGGPSDGEDPRNPFLLFNALLDLGEDLCSYAGTMHGGLFAVLMDEVMGTAANFQSEKGAYTVQFNTKFVKAVKLPQIVLVRGRVIRRDGRKIYVRGTIEDKNGELMGEADGLWIQMGRDIGRSQL